MSVSGISMSISISNVVYTKEEARHHLNTVLGHKYKRRSYFVCTCAVHIHNANIVSVIPYYTEGRRNKMKRRNVSY